MKTKEYNPSREAAVVPLEIQTLEKHDAAIQQIEAAIELFYAKRYAPAITLAGAAEGCLPTSSDEDIGDDGEEDIPGPEPLFEMMKRGAIEQYDCPEREAIGLFNAARDWLKHTTLKRPGRIELTNYDAWTMIVRAITKIEASRPGSETAAISGFIEHSREHYSGFLRR